LVLTCTDTV